MIRPVAVVALGLLLLGAAPVAFEARVESVHDGDTVRFAGGRVCRLLGLDAPELAQPLGEHAQRALVGLLPLVREGRPVTVLHYGRDRYGRLLCWVLGPGGEAVNLELVRAGLAEVYLAERSPFRHGLEAAQEEARNSRRGVWGLEGYESPSAYRKRLREGRARP